MTTSLDTWLRQNRVRAGDFAERVGIHPTTLSKVRRGKQLPTLPAALAIEKATGGAVPVHAWAAEEEAPAEARGAA